MGDPLDDGFRKTVRRISKDKGLSSLGDAFVNLVYSSAKSRSLGRPFGCKVSDRVLSRSLTLSGIEIPRRLNHGERGDIVEGTLAYAWSNNLITLEEAVGTVEKRLRRAELAIRSAEYDASAEAFSELFLIAMRRICGRNSGGSGRQSIG
ncbi:MAG: ribonuclease III family protein [Candidatus Verstraetearchaeota archaeon]|nr:ribonuclease III family protein [Candidatus Verstraetearchaeota archaeon]